MLCAATSVGLARAGWRTASLVGMLVSAGSLALVILWVARGAGASGKPS